MTHRKLLALPVMLIMLFAAVQLCGCALSGALASCSSVSDVMNAVAVDLFGEKEQEYVQLNVTLPRHAGYAPIEDKNGYESLATDDERKAYESMEQSLFRLTGEDGGEYGRLQLCRAMIPSLSSVEIFKVKEALRADHPEAFWFDSSYYSLGRNSHDGLYIIMYSTMTAEEIDSASRALSGRVASILREIPSGLNEYDRELLIHDIIVRDVEYDHAAAENMHLAPEAASVYGALVDGRAVCTGYSFSAKLLLNRVGIACRIVDGVMYSDTDNGHTWNLACIDGNWYHLDITNNDPTSYSSWNIRSYNYFNLTDKAISVTHEIAPDFKYLTEDTIQWGDDAANYYNFPLPECKSEKHNFYRRNAVAVTQLNDDGRRIIADSLRKCADGEGDTFYLIFPEDMEPDVISDWFNSFMVSEIEAANSLTAAGENGTLIESYSYAQGASVKWCNVFIFKLIYSSQQPVLHT